MRRMANAQAKSPHGFGTRFFYGIGSVAFGVKDNGFGALLLLFYNQALGLDARLAGLAIGIALVVDAFLDPLIGYASDHLRTRWGRRHPFMYAAAIPAALSYLFLFSPPPASAKPVCLPTFSRAPSSSGRSSRSTRFPMPRSSPNSPKGTINGRAI